MVATLGRFVDMYGNEVLLIHGGARGADRLADRFAKAHGWHVDEYLADWKTHGKRAGPIRNQRMLDEGRPQLVVAFPGGRGTADMVDRARAAGVSVRVVSYFSPSSRLR
jgi:hypothetical protein